MRIAILHYAYPPVIGGVEFVIEAHAALFARHGHEVTVICGEGEASPARPEVGVTVIPELSPGHPRCLAAQEQIAKGSCEGGDFSELKNALTEHLDEALQGMEVVFVHNLLTMHFNLAATAALWQLASREGSPRMINWVHDLSAINPDYRLPRLYEEPWNLITRSHPEIQAAAISSRRQGEFCELVGGQRWECPVVPNGIEVLNLLKLPRDVRNLARKHGIAYREIVLIHPTRILRRKNIELGVRVLAALREAGHTCIYLVTGAPDPHNDEAKEYGGEISELVGELGMEQDFVFVGHDFRVSDEDLAALYSLSDALFLPSRQEGFGLPLLEAGFYRLPAFTPRLEPMASILEHNVHLFDLEDDPAEIAKLILKTLSHAKGHLARKETILRYSWERIMVKQIGPLFLGTDPGSAE